ncbi:hypothetical protein ABZ901_08300 [Actinacidiphila alni]|uniref:hypothetical protein n=1 Tax=Actinacidiphila alni TaxID=380248 RepID=UPI0033F37457
MSEPTSGSEPRPEKNQPQWGQGAQPQQPPSGQWQPPQAAGGPGWGQQPNPGQPYGAMPYGPPPAGYGPPQKKKRRKWPWILLILVVLFAGGCAVIVATVSHEVTKTVKVKYSVTGTATNVTISYSTWHDDNISTSQETAKTLPWRKEVSTKGFIKGGTLTITLGEAGGKAECSVVVDNGTPKTATASGPFATASCDGF